MTQSLAELEARRRELFQELEELGDFRPGMISTNYRRCGKQLCTTNRRFEQFQPIHRANDDLARRIKSARKSTNPQINPTNEGE